jgi:hypothetical protein
MVHAGAAAGVYDLKTMAFESVEGMVRAGMSFRFFFNIKLLTKSTRCYAYPVVLHAQLFGMVVVTKIRCTNKIK